MSAKPPLQLRLYRTTLRWAQHRYASAYLALVSAAEASFFPVPPDIMLVPMTLARPKRVLYYALLTTLASVAGALVGYAIGHFLFEAWALPYIQARGYEAHYSEVTQAFKTWGSWGVLVAAFTPIPYKVFTVAAGVGAMPLLPFVLASLLGRGLRYALVAGLSYCLRDKMEAVILSLAGRIAWWSLWGALALSVVMVLGLS